MKTAEPKAKDANVEKCVDLMRSRAYLGLKKYGKTTERTDLTPLEWVRHWQAENADATIYAEKLAQEIENLTATNARLEAMLAERNDELEVLRKAVADGGRFLLIAANRYASGNHTEFRAMQSMAAIALGVELQWPKTGTSAETDKVFVQVFNMGNSSKRNRIAVATGRAREQVSKQGASAVQSPLAPDPSSLANDPSSLTPSEQWHDAQTNPPEAAHAVIGMVNGTTKTRAVYYVAETGKWVDVNDRPVTVSQWRHL